MRSHIEELEKKATVLEPARQTHKSWHEKLFTHAADFVDQIDTHKAYDSEDSSRLLEDFPITDQGKSFDDLLKVLGTAVDRPGINPASGGHLGYIPGGGVIPAAFGDYLAAISNRYAGVYYANPGAVRMENLLIRWMADLFGFPEDSHGNLASGGSIANLIAITTAREAMGIRARDFEKSVIYLHGQTHHCVEKALRIAGLGEAQLRLIDLDERFRMKPDSLQEQIQRDKADGLRPFMIVASLGSTDTGAVDPIDDIGKVAAQNNVWFHVDAAYGGFFVLVDGMKHYFKGIENADSLVIDPHKGLFLPYGLGVVLVRNGMALQAAHKYTANYMRDAIVPDEFSPAELSPELTKHFRGLRMWLPMQLFGLAPFRSALEEKWQLALYFYTRIQETGFETGPEPELSVVIYRYSSGIDDPNAFNRQLVELMHEDGRIFISSTVIDGRVWLRFAALCFRTHLRHIDLLLEMLTEKRDLLLEQK